MTLLFANAVCALSGGRARRPAPHLAPRGRHRRRPPHGAGAPAGLVDQHRPREQRQPRLRPGTEPRQSRPAPGEDRFGRAGAARRSTRSTPAQLAALRGHSVAVEPWEVAAAWAYGLDWLPLPVFQNYTAYTARLDRLNSEAIEDPARGPERILRENQALVVPQFPATTSTAASPSGIRPNRRGRSSATSSQWRPANAGRSSAGCRTVAANRGCWKR